MSTSPSNPEQVQLRPTREGLVVAVPGRRRPLAAAGELVVLSTYWRRRLDVGDVEYVQTPAQPDSVPPGRETP